MTNTSIQSLATFGVSSVQQEHNLRNTKNILTAVQRIKDKENAQISPISKELSNANLIRKNLQKMQAIVDQLSTATLPTEKQELQAKLAAEAEITNAAINQNGFNAVMRPLEFGGEVIQVHQIANFPAEIADFAAGANRQLMDAVQGIDGVQINYGLMHDIGQTIFVDQAANLRNGLTNVRPVAQVTPANFNTLSNAIDAVVPNHAKSIGLTAAIRAVAAKVGNAALTDDEYKALYTALIADVYKDQNLNNQMGILEAARAAAPGAPGAGVLTPEQFADLRTAAEGQIYNAAIKSRQIQNSRNVFTLEAASTYLENSVQAKKLEISSLKENIAEMSEIDEALAEARYNEATKTAIDQTIATLSSLLRNEKAMRYIHNLQKITD